MPAFRIHTLSLLLGGFVACGGSGVEPLDPKDLTLPPDTRQWIADAQDGVIAARATRDNTQARLAELQKWAASVDAVEFSGSGGGALEDRMDALAQTRVAAAEADVSVAESNVTLAERKLDLAYAERSMLHDIASYDLGELRDAVAEAKREARARTEARREREKREREAEDAWWKAYAKFASGGKTASYWTAGIEPLARSEAKSAGNKSAQAQGGDAKPAAEGTRATRGRVATDKKTERRKRSRKK